MVRFPLFTSHQKTVPSFATPAILAPSGLKVKAVRLVECMAVGHDAIDTVGHNNSPIIKQKGRIIFLNSIKLVPLKLLPRRASILHAVAQLLARLLVRVVLRGRRISRRYRAGYGRQ